MDEIRLPKFQWGQPVLAAIDLVNDGTFLIALRRITGGAGSAG